MLPVFSVDFDIVSRARQQPLDNRMWLLHMPNRLFCQAKLRTADISQLSCCFCFPMLPRNQSHRTWRRAKRWHHNQHTEGKHYQPQYNFRSVAHVFASILTMFCVFPQVRIKLLSWVQKCTCCGSLRYCTWNSIFSCTEQGSPQELLCSTYVSDTAVQAPPK